MSSEVNHDRYDHQNQPEALVIKRGGHGDQLSRQWGLDRYRIQALKKLLAEPGLPDPYRLAAQGVLAAKCAIYAQGCEKRGKLAEARLYRELGRQVSQETPLTFGFRPLTGGCN